MHIRVTSIGTALLITVSLLSCGCLGSYVSRTSRDDKGDTAGKWPYQAVAQDLVVIAEPLRNKEEWRREMANTFALYGLVSIPSDLVCDTILLPVDLVLWPWGFEKSRIDRQPYCVFVTPARRQSGQGISCTATGGDQRQNQAAQSAAPKVADPGR